MKVIFVGAYDTPEFGGINTYMLRLSQKLSEKGIECLIIRQSTRDYEIDIEGVRFINLAIKGPRFMELFFYFKATYYILKNRLDADVICFQSCLFYNQYSKLLSKKGYKVCCVQHSFAIDNPKNNKLIGKVVILLEKLTTLGTVNIITVSEHNAQLIKKRLNKDSYIVRCGINLPSNSSINNDLIKVFDLMPDNYFLSISRIDQVKNLDVLIEAFQNYSGNKKLVICGNTENDYGQKLKKLAANNSKICFTGPVIGEQKEALLKNCFAFIIVSSSEGFPISLLEAMAYGKCCVTSDISPIREAMGDELGYWCKVGDIVGLTGRLNEIEVDMGRKQKEQAIYKRVGDYFTWDAASLSFISYISKL